MVSMAAFDLEEFVANPTLGEFEKCRKAELFAIAAHYGISVATSLLKRELKLILLSGLTSKGVFDLPASVEDPDSVVGAMAAVSSDGGRVDTAEPSGVVVPSALQEVEAVEPQLAFTPGARRDAPEEKPPLTLPRFEPVSIESSSGCRLDARLKIRLARLQLETQEKREEREFQLRRELELRKLEAETAIKMRQLELQTGDVMLRSPDGARSVSSSTPTFDVSKNIALVPTFREAEIESYFGAFERIAVALHWPKDVWAILLQCNLAGKAQEACSSLSVEDSLVYEKVKSAILRVYELVPEAYRQRFRGLRKHSNQTFADFAREKGILFDRWCSACKAEDFTSVRELMLLEEFKNCVPERTVIYLNEQKVTTLQKAAALADEFALTHRAVFSKRDSSSRDVAEKPGDMHARTHPPSTSTFGAKSEKQCFFCHRPGHLVADCITLKRKQQAAASRQPKGVGLIKTVSPSGQPTDQKVPDACFRPFIFSGVVSLTGKSEDQRPVTVLRDTGGSQSFILSSVLPLSATSACNVSTIVRGIGMGFVPAPLHYIHVKSDLITGFFPVAVRSCFPVDGVDFIMGNDIAGGKVHPSPEVVDLPISEPGNDDLANRHPDVFSVSVLTRAQARKQAQEVDLSDSLFASVLSQEKLPPVGELVHGTPEFDSTSEPVTSPAVSLPLTREAFISAQRGDPSLAKCFSAVAEDTSECRGKQVFFVESGVLMRKWVSQAGEAADDSERDWATVRQVVVPAGSRKHVLELAHEHLWSGHLGVTKTYDRILKHFFWPGLKADVVRFCKTCRTCQIVGKPNQTVPPAPLRPIPAVDEPFERVIVDCVGPLPRTKAGNQFLLTVMCVTTRFPEAIPLRRITAPAITKALTKFFTTFGLPKTVQTDQGTNFLSRTFKQTLQSLGVSHSVSSAYHPESQGALERWHQTLKSMLQRYCHDTGKDWDEGVPFVLFAIRDAKQESLGFSPAELVFGHNVRGPLKVLKEQLMSSSSPRSSLSDFVVQCKERLHHASAVAKEALSSSQERMKCRFDRKAVRRQFQPGDKVLVLLPMPGSSLTARFSGPYLVKSQVSDTDYVIHTPERRRKTRLCHINMLKSYHSRAAAPGEQENTPETATPDKTSVSLVCADSMSDDGLAVLADQQCGRLRNSELLSVIDEHLSYLPVSQRNDVVCLLRACPSLFGDVPSCTTVLKHDIDVGSAKPIKQHAYRCPLAKREVMRKEAEYLLEHGLAEPSHSPWSSPCLLAPKSDGTPRFCTDFRKVNAVTVPDYSPMTRLHISSV